MLLLGLLSQISNYAHRKAVHTGTSLSLQQHSWTLWFDYKFKWAWSKDFHAHFVYGSVTILQCIPPFKNPAYTPVILWQSLSAASMTALCFIACFSDLTLPCIWRAWWIFVLTTIMHVADHYCSTTVPSHRLTCTRPSHFPLCNIRNLGMGLSTRLRLMCNGTHCYPTLAHE